LNTLTGHRSAPRRLHRPADETGTGCGAGFRRLSGGRAVAPSGDCGSGNPAFSLAARVPQRAVSYAWTRPLLFCHAVVPVTVSVRGKASDPGTSLRVPPGWTGDMTERLVAQSASAGSWPSASPLPCSPWRFAAVAALPPAPAQPRRSNPTRPRCTPTGGLQVRSPSGV